MELAGAFAELARTVLQKDFRRIDPSQARVVLIEAQAAAMLVKAQAYTQSAMSELIRVRAIDMANAGAGLKFNADHASQTRQQVREMFKK